ncbi:protein ninH [Providencia alcalifaciens]|uniref:protein ninH n=2 Tax=Providencia alcalifaciens TaxID=126385 RepID=UPI003BF81616
MQAEITTIPELLVKHYGNMTEVGRLIGANRATIRKYVRDASAESHIVINGRLMVRHRGGDRWKCKESQEAK